MARVLMKGNEAIAETICRADVKAAFGYPITPQNEIPEYLSRELSKRGGFFLQSESELAGINMVIGASATGVRVVTTTSGPGLSLMLEAISSMTLTRLPCVIIDVCRSGPGMGDLAPAQEDLKISGNGAHKFPILLPGTVQEAAEIVYEAFDIADQYWTPVVVIVDGMIGQMMEPVDFDKLPPRRQNLPEKTWRLAGTDEKGYRTKMSIHYNDTLCERTAKMENIWFPDIEANEKRSADSGIEDADIVFASYGTASRMVRTVIKENQNPDMKIGWIQCKTYWPFPTEPFTRINPKCKAVIVPEINILGQLIDDVRIQVAGRFPVYHVGNTAKGPMNVGNVAERLQEIWEIVK